MHITCRALRQKGFSLVEVIATLMLLGVSLVAVSSLFSMGNQMAAVDQGTHVVCGLLQRKMEEARSRPFDDDVSETGVYYTGYAGYNIDVTQDVDYLGYTDDGKLKRITVTVGWTENNQWRSETIYSCISNRLLRG